MSEAAEPLSCTVEELRTLFLFEELTDDQLQWLCERGHVELLPAGPCTPRATRRLASTSCSTAPW